MLIYILNTLFTVYTFLLLARVLGSWFPSFAQSKLMAFVAYYTDPYLNLFRKIIPPIGPMDISPLFAFIGLQVMQWVLIAILR